MVRVVLFSGGRGSGALAERLASDPNVDLTIAINGYDDGASTGRVRRFLGDALGPSDFRKNASRLARQLQTCPMATLDLLDSRLPVDCSPDVARAALEAIRTGHAADAANAAAVRSAELARSLDHWRRQAIVSRLVAFEQERLATGKLFDYADCAIGNLVFAGCFLLERRNFNQAVDDYCALVGLRPGMIENVTDGTNAFLVALETDGSLLATEEAIVDARRRNQVRDIFLLPQPLSEADQAVIGRLDPDERVRFLASRDIAVSLNTRLASRLE